MSNNIRAAVKSSWNTQGTGKRSNQIQAEIHALPERPGQLYSLR
jgi:hypothetical protein